MFRASVFHLAMLLPCVAMAMPFDQTLQVSPASLVFNATVGGVAPVAQTLNISSTLGAVSFTVSTSTGTNWIQLSAQSGITPAQLTVGIDPSKLSAGIYNASIIIGPTTGGVFSPQTIPVTLNLSPGLTTNPSSLAFAFQIGGTAPAAQVVAVGSSGTPLTFTAAAVTNSGNSWLSVAPVSGTTPANLNISTNTTGLSPGTYTGTVTITSTGSNTSSTQSIKVTLTVTASNPTITAVVNAGSFQNTAIAPGEIVTLGGTGLGPLTPAGLALDQNGKVSTQIGGVQVLFGGFAAPLIYVSSTQINAVVPYEVQGLVNPVVQVKYQGQTSNSFAVVPSSTSPALFSSNGSGTGPAAALNQDLSYNTPNTPAPKGSYVFLYMTGEGQTAPAGVTGKVTTVSATPPLTPQPLLPLAVLIGGQPASVVFYGEAPGYVSGVMQVNVQIPPNAASGSLPILVSVGGNSTQVGATISVQ